MVRDEIWASIAAGLESAIAAGRRHLLTEDSVRGYAIEGLVGYGFDPSSIAIEWAPGDSRGIKHDLVIGTPPSEVMEFKFPRAPRSGNRPYPQVVGSLLSDLYRLAESSIPER